MSTYSNKYHYECGEGWYQLIDSIVETIEDYNASLEKDAEPIKILQIKEKFGYLRIYVSRNAPESIKNLINEAETKSFKICENCGSNKNVGMTASHGWYRTLCSKCFESLKETDTEARITYYQ